MDENKIYSKCQSCAMAIKKDESKGTEIDQSLSNKYCTHCYKDGAFTQPNIKLETMQEMAANGFKEAHPFMFRLFGKMYVKSIAKVERWNQENN